MEVHFVGYLYTMDLRINADGTYCNVDKIVL